eukprot:4797895-Amphidinium_carterae.1
MAWRHIILLVIPIVTAEQEYELTTQPDFLLSFVWSLLLAWLARHLWSKLAQQRGCHNDRTTLGPMVDNSYMDHLAVYANEL